MDGLHISSFIEQFGRTAKALVDPNHLLADDWYSNNIRESAQEMVDDDCPDWTYGGQYSSGNCFWQSPNQEYSHLVILN